MFMLFADCDILLADPVAQNVETNVAPSLISLLHQSKEMYTILPAVLSLKVNMFIYHRHLCNFSHIRTNRSTGVKNTANGSWVSQTPVSCLHESCTT